MKIVAGMPSFGSLEYTWSIKPLGKTLGFLTIVRRKQPDLA